MSFFRYNDKQIFYEQFGQGAPLLLLHGNTVSSKLFLPIVPFFSKRHTVIIMDFQGCGQSERVERWPLDLWHQWGAGSCFDPISGAFRN